MVMGFFAGVSCDVDAATFFAIICVIVTCVGFFTLAGEEVVAAVERVFGDCLVGSALLVLRSDCLVGDFDCNDGALFALTVFTGVSSGICRAKEK